MGFCNYNNNQLELFRLYANSMPFKWDSGLFNQTIQHLESFEKILATLNTQEIKKNLAGARLHSWNTHLERFLTGVRLHSWNTHLESF